MAKHSNDKEELRNSILGFGKRSMKKSYFSQLQKTEEELERYRSLIEESSEAVCILETETFRFLDVNSGAAALFRMLREELLESSFLSLIPAEEVKAVENWYRKNPDKRLSREMTILYNEETTVINYSLKRGSYRNDHYITLIANDVTRLHSAQEQLHQSDKLKAIGQLAGGIAHDFNNQLTGVVGFAEMIQLDSQAGSDLHTYASNILSCTKQATQLTSKLLAFARKRTKAKIQIDIHHVIKEVVALLMHSIDKKIEITVDLSADKSVVMGDGSQIQNALLNLGVNARDAMAGTGKLIFSTKGVTINDDFLESHPEEVPVGDYIMISVTDNGSGIPVEIQKKIFEPFFTTKKEGRGTGLGLAAVYGTIQDHDGFMTLYSEADIGTTFNIYFPLVVGSAIEDTPESEFHIAPGSGLILLIDDEPALRDVAKKILERNGYSVITACNGSEGLKTYMEHAHQINLVIVDMIMPVMNGLETMTSIRESGSTVPVLIASGYAHNGEIDQALLEKDVFFIQKPFLRKDLLTTVEKYIRH